MISVLLGHFLLGSISTLLLFRARNDVVDAQKHDLKIFYLKFTKLGNLRKWLIIHLKITFWTE